MTIKRAKTKTADRTWVKTRRALLRHIKGEVKRRLGDSESKDITDFTTRYEKELRKTWKISSQQELLNRVEESDLIYGGDFHALAQAQRTHLRVLRQIKKPVVLALEAFQASAQKHLDAFIHDKITLAELRQLSNWDQVWGFSWDHYRPLLELAKARRFKVVALNSKPGKHDLKSREERAAKLIARVWSPDHLTYVIFGDLHLAPEHLPQKVNAKLKRRTKDLTIHLNSERVYFQLASRGLETDVDVVKFSEKSFCILSTPPWIKWQSYLLFLEHALDGDERIDDETDFDPTDQVALLVRLAADDLGLSKQFKQINDLAVYGENDETIWREVARRTADGERETAQSLLRAGQRFFLPQGGVAYQPKPTINSAASLAGLYLHARLSKRRKSLFDFPKDLRANVWIEAVSYFISKMINHARRSETVAGLQSKLQSKLQKKNSEALRLALDVRLSEMVRAQSGRKRPLQIQPRRRSSYVEASRILGGMLGERLYVAYRSRKLKKDTVVMWLTRDPGSRAFLDSYDGIVEKIVSLSN